MTFFALLNWRMWVGVGLLALAPILYMKGRIDGGKAVRHEWTESVAQANAEARALEQRRQRRADEAGELAASRDAVLRADADRAGNALDRLRNAITARRLAEESNGAAVKRADTLGNLLAACGKEYQELARRADRHVRDERLLIESWPK